MKACDLRRSSGGPGRLLASLLSICTAWSVGCLKKGDTNLAVDSDAGGGGAAGAAGAGGGGSSPVCDQDLCFTVSKHSTGEQPLAMVVTDLNGDARPDVATANFKSNDISVLLTKSDGTLGAPATYAGVEKQSALVAASLNNDGAMDLLAVRKVGASIQVQVNDGSGLFSLGTAVSTGVGANGAALADLDGDGLPELVAALSSSDPAKAVGVWTNTGGGAFGPVTHAATGAIPYAVAVADVDGDGKVDAALAAADNRIHVLRNDGTGKLSESGAHDAGSQPLWILAAQLDAGPALDLVTVNQGSGTVSVFLGTGGGAYAPQLVFGVGASPRTIATADLNEDGKQDLVVGSESLPGVSILLNDGTGHFSDYRKVKLGSSPMAVGAADFDSDGRGDVVVSTTSNQVYVLRGAK